MIRLNIYLIFSFLIPIQVVYASKQPDFFYATHINQLMPLEGFTAGTLVKTPHGYVPIETIVSGALICACNIKTGESTERRVLHVKKVMVSGGIQITCNGEILGVGGAQKFFVQSMARWMTTRELIESIDLQNALSSGHIQITKISEPIELYQLSVETDHTFYVTTQDFLVHNAASILIISPGFLSTSALAAIATPVIAVAVPVAAGWIIWNVVSAQIQKNKKTGSNSGAMAGGGGGFGGPDDPEWPPKKKGGGKKRGGDRKKKKKDEKKKREEKKKERDNARQEHRALTNKEARAEAKKLGYIEDKSPPFDSLGMLTFRKGNDWISPDKYGHRGGVWKRFSGRNRVGTYDRSLKNRIGD